MRFDGARDEDEDMMSVFQHPHLTRGIVKTEKGAFFISRGLVEMPDEVGEALGWRQVDGDDDRPVVDRSLVLTQPART